ncbi:hemicentin-1-like isoform X2 [Melanotaenia boesemani]|uniref:hemicentin-1-like isoform X2 n=1 Tax=Melanotaenia boesemani TaxID=1250792 RepID=UPI001C042A80|nr:hemicentin-1-like isoform X2 [Melanotaenia boesemani]
MRESFQHQTRMFVFFWITVFVSVRGSSADTGAPVWTYPYCHDKFCITLMDGPIRAEAGLCAVVPCYFTTGDGFTLQHIVWYKCGQNKERCGESDTIFNTNKTNENIKFGFKGRVSLLEPDVSQRNCSIMINDLSKSDSGWYQLRVNGLFYGKTDGWTFIPKTNISVTGLKQKLTVKVPPLTEGQQTTLTCTAPGLCSGSHPKITWMWRGAGEKDVYIPGNITAVHTENLTVVSQRHSSSLTFNLSAEHHNTNVTCKISFTEDTTTEKTVTLQVNHVKEVKINGDRDVEEGKPLNLTCHVESFPPSLVSWTRSGTATYLTKDTLSVQQNKSPTCLEKERICSLFISNLTAEDSGLYICNVKHLNNTMTKEVNITVIYKRKVQISGRTTVKTGDALNLTCSIESFPPSLIMWTKQSSSTNLQSGISLLNDTGSATLVISNVTAEDSGQYVCTAKHLNTTMTELTDVTVTYKRKVQISGRTTVKTGDALNLTCSIESFPPSLIMWTKQNSSTNLQSGISLLNDTGSATFFISNVTAEDSGQYVCTAKHLNTTVTELADVTVTYKRKVQISGRTTVKTGDALNLTCSIESFPPSLIMWTKQSSSTNLQSGISLLNDTGSATLVISNVTAEDSGQYVCTAKHLNTTMTELTDVTVTYKRKVQISGRTIVKKGDALNLTCSIESFPPSLIMWTKRSSSTNLQSGISLLNDTGSATLFMSNVTAEDSGQYVCTAKHLNTTVTELTDVTVTYKRKVQISGRTTVKRGDALNLTCSIESFPPSHIMWTKQNSSTNLQSEIILFKDTRPATLFISNVTAEDSGQYVCTAKHLNTTVTELTDVTVTYKRKVQISGRTTVKKGDALNLTCSIESFPPSLIMWTKQSSSTNLQSGISLLNDTGSATLFISNMTAEDSGQYVCTAKHLNTTVTELTDVTVTYKRKVQISDRTTVKKGDALNLTCSIESFPPSLIMWTKQSSSTNIQSGISLLNDTGSATLFISNVTAEDSGQYVCTAKHLNTTVTELADVTVTWFSKILDGSGCVHQSGVLTCVCISEGFPLPFIKWPLLQNHREYSVITMASGYTVNSTVTLTVKHHDNMTIECVSRNDDGEAKLNFSIQQNIPEKEDEFRNILEKAPWLEIVIAFLIGVVLTASTCCLTIKCFRKQQKSSGNLDETLEMVTRNDPLIYDGQAGEDQTCIQEVLENGAVVAEKSISEPNSGPREVVYASIDLSLLKTKNPREARKEQDNTKTEYAEIKTERRENEEENGGKEGEILEDKEEEVMMEEVEEVQHFVTEEEKEAEEAVYSNVKDLMVEI